MQGITTCLWFDGRAEEAVKFYGSVFKYLEVRTVTRTGKEVAEAARIPEGSVLTISFKLANLEFLALNGGPQFKFSEAISLIVNCDTQNEIDWFWEKLSEGGGEKGQCGWLKDKYGLSWQIVPTVLAKLMQDKNAAKTERVMAALMQMQKLDIEALKKAYSG